MARLTRQTTMGRRILRKVWRVACAAGVITLVVLAWLAAGGPTGLDRWLDVTEPPVRAQAIVVLGAGTGDANLPLQQGWERLATAERLFAAGFAPVAIFSGSGSQRVSQAEIYANAAAWLGIPRSVMVLEANATSTADHGRALKGLNLPTGTVIAEDTPLLVVTSAFHSRRALMSFARAGFTRVRVVSRFTNLASHARIEGSRVNAAPAAGSPAALTNTVAGYQPSDKRYDDVLIRLAYRTFDFFISLREVGAILLS